MTVLKTAGVIFLLLTVGWSQSGEIIPLSPKVGLEVDAEENAFYRIFPEITGFESAQFYRVNPNRIVARIVFVEYSHRKLTRKSFNLRQFTILQNHVNRQPEITEHDRLALRGNMTYLETKAVLSSIPVNQFVTIKHRDGARLRGTLLQFDGKWLELQTLVSIVSIPIWKLERIAYRPEIKQHPQWSTFVYLFCAGVGLGLSEIWNEQTRPRIEMVWHNRFFGTVLGLLAGAEVLDTVNILASPRTTFSLTPEESERLK
jgi:hypothetical protein